MRITEEQIRKIIREFLLTEEIFGRQAFVYHGSTLNPEKFMKIMREDRFLSGIGGGAGAEMGRALYAVPERADGEKQATTFEGHYGSYVYRLKVNLNGYAILDERMCALAYGKVLPIIEQMRVSGEDDIVEMISGDPDLLAWAELDLRKALLHVESKRKLELIMREHGRGYADSYAVQIYDPMTAVPVAWKYLYDDEYMDEDTGLSDPMLGWHSFDKSEIRAHMRQSFDFTPGKLSPLWFFKEIMRGKRTFDRPINITETELEEKIPADFRWPSEPITINDDLTFGHRNDYPFSQLPPNLTVAGDLTIALNMRSLPTGLRVGKNLNIRDTEVSALPRDIQVGGDVIHSDKVQNFKVPPGARVGGSVLNSSEHFERMLNG